VEVKMKERIKSGRHIIGLVFVLMGIMLLSPEAEATGGGGGGVPKPQGYTA